MIDISTVDVEEVDEVDKLLSTLIQPIVFEVEVDLACQWLQLGYIDIDQCPQLQHYRLLKQQLQLQHSKMVSDVEIAGLATSAISTAAISTAAATVVGAVSAKATLKFTVDRDGCLFHIEGDHFNFNCYSAILSCQDQHMDEVVNKLKTVKLSKLGCLLYQSKLAACLAKIPESEFPEDKVGFTSEDLSHLVSCGCCQRTTSSAEGCQQ